MYSGKGEFRKGGDVEDNDRHDMMLMGLVYRARWDEDFRRAAHENPEETLAQYRYQLTDSEMAAVMAFYEDVKDLTDEDLNRELANRAGPLSAMGAENV